MIECLEKEGTTVSRVVRKGLCPKVTCELRSDDLRRRVKRSQSALLNSGGRTFQTEEGRVQRSRDRNELCIGEEKQ